LAIFKVVELLFNLSDPHCIITKSLLNFADCLRLGIPKFLTKLDAVLLLQAFCHLEQNENAMNMCYTTSLSGRDRCTGGVVRQQEITHTHKSPFYHYTQFPRPFAITYRGKNIDRPCIRGENAYLGHVVA
jgi:hypothetical protein